MTKYDCAWGLNVIGNKMWLPINVIDDKIRSWLMIKCNWWLIIPLMEFQELSITWISYQLHCFQGTKALTCMFQRQCSRQQKCRSVSCNLSISEELLVLGTFTKKNKIKLDRIVPIWKFSKISSTIKWLIAVRKIKKKGNQVSEIMEKLWSSGAEGQRGIGAS